MQRRFAREHPKAIHYDDDSIESEGEVSDEEPHAEEDESGSVRGRKRPRSTTNLKKKSKSGASRGGRVAKGQDWWLQVETFFKEKRSQWGDNVESLNWKQ